MRIDTFLRGVALRPEVEQNLLRAVRAVLRAMEAQLSRVELSSQIAHRGRGPAHIVRLPRARLLNRAHRELLA